MSTDTVNCTVITPQRTAYELEVVACTACGFHLGLDASYLEQVGRITTICPACSSPLAIAGADDAEDDAGTRHAAWTAAKRAAAEPENRIAATITVVRGGRVTFHDPRNGEQTGSQYLEAGCTEDVDILNWDEDGLLTVRFADGDAAHFDLRDGHIRLAIRSAERRIRLTPEQITAWRAEHSFEVRYPGGFILGIDGLPDSDLASGSAEAVLFDEDGAQLGSYIAPTCAGPFVVTCPAGTFTAVVLPPAATAISAG